MEVKEQNCEDQKCARRQQHHAVIQQLLSNSKHQCHIIAKQQNVYPYDNSKLTIIQNIQYSTHRHGEKNTSQLPVDVHRRTMRRLLLRVSVSMIRWTSKAFVLLIMTAKSPRLLVRASPLVLLRYVFKRRRQEKVRSKDADATGSYM